ncbi:MAG: hypothetical protein ACRELA_21670, partial [Candidatus Rokuibacteriota bacterium]
VRTAWELDGSAQNQAVDHAHLDIKPGSSAGFFWPGDRCEAKKQPFASVMVIPVDASAADSPYAERSAWAFRTRMAMKPGDRDEQGSTVELGSGKATLALTAFRDPPQWVQDALDEQSRCAFGGFDQ